MTDTAARLSQVSECGIMGEKVPYIAGLAASTTVAEPAAARGTIPTSISGQTQFDMDFFFSLFLPGNVTCASASITLSGGTTTIAAATT